MFAQKTDALLRRVRVQRLSSAIQGTSCLLIKHCFDDTRYSVPDTLVGCSTSETNEPPAAAQTQDNSTLKINANVRQPIKTAVITHDKKYDTDCISVSTLRELHDIVLTKQYLFIDEGQFFEDLDLVIYWALLGKTITIAALDADSKQQLWPSVQRVMPYCLYGQQTACCDKCGHPNATLSVPVTANSKSNNATQSRILIGGKESFLAVCLHCKYT